MGLVDHQLICFHPYVRRGYFFFIFMYYYLKIHQ